MEGQDLLVLQVYKETQVLLVHRAELDLQEQLAWQEGMDSQGQLDRKAGQAQQEQLAWQEEMASQVLQEEMGEVVALVPLV